MHFDVALGGALRSRVEGVARKLQCFEMGMLMLGGLVQQGEAQTLPLLHPLMRWGSTKLNGAMVSSREKDAFKYNSIRLMPVGQISYLEGPEFANRVQVFSFGGALHRQWPFALGIGELKLVIPDFGPIGLVSQWQLITRSGFTAALGHAWGPDWASRLVLSFKWDLNPDLNFYRRSHVLALDLVPSLFRKVLDREQRARLVPSRSPTEEGFKSAQASPGPRRDFTSHSQKKDGPAPLSFLNQEASLGTLSAKDSYLLCGIGGFLGAVILFSLAEAEFESGSERPVEDFPLGESLRFRGIGTGV